ncbi:MAG TPA: hypothetical protein VHY56_12415, partial [Candidatus Binataceae bacterium]|nr:hypothetical protein [Candidatus Binataceae bacterium]
DAESPLYGLTPAMLKASLAELTVSVTGIDETVSETVHSRHSYDAADIIWGARMVDIMTRSPTGEFAIDYSHFNEIVPVELPPANQDGAVLPPPGMNE